MIDRSEHLSRAFTMLAGIVKSPTTIGNWNGLFIVLDEMVDGTIENNYPEVYGIEEEEVGLLLSYALGCQNVNDETFDIYIRSAAVIVNRVIEAFDDYVDAKGEFLFKLLGVNYD